MLTLALWGRSQWTSCRSQGAAALSTWHQPPSRRYIRSTIEAAAIYKSYFASNDNDLPLPTVATYRSTMDKQTLHWDPTAASLPSFSTPKDRLRQSESYSVLLHPHGLGSSQDEMCESTWTPPAHAEMTTCRGMRCERLKACRDDAMNYPGLSRRCDSIYK